MKCNIDIQAHIQVSAYTTPKGEEGIRWLPIEAMCRI